MKDKKLSLSVEQPCDKQHWEQMIPNPTGRFCLHCQENIIDFTQMTDDEVMEILANAKRKVCGKFRADQLNKPMQLTGQKPSSPRFHQMLAAFMIITAGGTAACTTQQGAPIYAQHNIDKASSKTDRIEANPTAKKPNSVTGTVWYQDDDELLIGCSVMLKGTSTGAICDLDGKFELIIPPAELKKEELILQFLMIGLKRKEFKIKTDSLPLKMEVVLENDNILLGKIEVVPAEPNGEKLG